MPVLTSGDAKSELPSMTGWVWRYEGLDPDFEGMREALCSLGNGRFATRAAAPESSSDGVHYLGTYAAGVFNRLADEVGDTRVENESMVNLPDWQSLTWRPEGGEWLDLSAVKVTEYVQDLDLRRAVLTRRFRVEDAAGRRTRVAQRRLVSMADPFLAALDCTLLAENWSGRLTIRSGLDGRVSNCGVTRYRDLSGIHLAVERAEVADDGILRLEAETVQSHIRIGLAGRHRLLLDGRPVKTPAHPVDETSVAAVDLEVEMIEGRPVTVEKVVALCTSRDPAVVDPSEAAVEEVRPAEFDAVLSRHVTAWENLWNRCDVHIEGSPHALLIVRLHLYHLLSTVSEHSAELDVGIPARGLCGEAYRGHVFWDEVFVLPFLSLRLPHVARAMLLYRWRRLRTARAAAREAGYRGAMYPWQSGATGREESQTLHLNPRSGRWLADNSRLQRHVGLAVAYNTWRYYEATEDLDFLDRHGAEMILAVATFFADLATYDRVDDRFSIRGVMGPDEYHDALPGQDRPGLDDNAYTNVMTAWTLMRAMECIERLPAGRSAELLDSLGITRADLERWEHISRRLRLHWHPDGVLSQFRGYEQLAELDWDSYRDRYGDISRLDRNLESEGDSTNCYRLGKQADVLKIFFLLSADEWYAVLDRLGYPHDKQTIPRTVRFYRDRTSHGSTLSKVVHCWVLARSDRPGAWQYFLEALDSDIARVKGSTTAEGIHLGAMAGTVDLLQRGFSGLETREDTLGLDPCLPDALTMMRFRIHYRRHSEVEIAITHTTVSVRSASPSSDVLPFRVRDVEHRLTPRAGLEIPLHRRQPARLPPGQPPKESPPGHQ
jgi:trehalose/maltose hydrolase-like predicted phosphorylase